MKSIALILFLVISSSINAQQYNWPMWRFDHGRSAATPEKLSETLYLQWQIRFSPREPVWDDPLNQDLMQFDRIFEPIVYDQKIFLGFNDQDKVIALDINTGRELWHYFADGPVRLPLAANGGNIYFTSDDGYCYCLNANTGDPVWKLNLAPAPNKLLGNKRMISMWPARGGIVIKNDILYTAASIFPMMGTFIYAIDANNGRILWKNDGTGSNYILQPHKSPAFADIAPQGSFTISGDKLLVAGGRTVPAAFDLKTGEELYYKLAESGKTGGAFTCANDRIHFNHHRNRITYMYNSSDGSRIKTDPGGYPVVEGNNIYFSGKEITASFLTDSNRLEKLWTIDVSAGNDLIKAGDCLYAADTTGSVSAVKIRNGRPEKLWTINTGKPAERLLAANGKLIAVTEDGTIMVYGDTPVNSVATISREHAIPSSEKINPAAGILETTRVKKGYAVVYGSCTREFLKGLVTASDLNILVIENSTKVVKMLREYFDSLSVPAYRLCFLNKSESSSLPKYFSSLTIVNDPDYLNNFDGETIRSVYESVRPYDGKLWLRTKRRDQKKLSAQLARLDIKGAVLNKDRLYTTVTRTGALEGSADWTHNYGNISNTVKSDDEIVKAPLGILWFGGNSNLDVLPRHGHGPSEQVIDGYLIIQGINSISARDVYTGRMIWKKVFENLKDDNWLVYYDETYDEENPLDPKYNQVHIPGANARGTNFIATKEYVYAIEGNKCHLLDIKTGEEVKTITSGDSLTQKFAYIGVYKDYLILGNNFTEYPEIPADEKEKSNPKFENYDLTASRELLILNRFTGNKVWSIEANHGFIHNSVIAGDDVLFCLDKLPQALETKLRRRGENIPGGSRLLYLDISSGKKIHEETENIFGTWLGYSAEHKLLLQATRPSRDMLNGETGNRILIYKTGTKEILWDKAIKYSNPPIISNDKIYTEGEGFSLLTGDPILEKDPVTGEETRWKFKREYGCGYIVASEHLLTFRSASAAFVNLESFEGTASLGGFKAGCSANLIVANGVLNSPDYTRTCQCPYQNQTSLAFINMPWMNYWTNSNYKWNGKQIRQLGLNLNAPGDRTASNNVLWLEFPDAGGASSDIPVKIDSVNSFTVRKDPININSNATPWITASAMGGIRSMEITLSKENEVQEASYKVNLYFSEPENKKAGERVFDIKLQDKTVQENFDIMKESGQADKEIIKSFTGIRAGKTLKIDLEPVAGNTILSGVELIREL
jgi:outer membrane protein assembly factor BamB